MHAPKSSGVGDIGEATMTNCRNPQPLVHQDERLWVAASAIQTRLVRRGVPGTLQMSEHRELNW